ncbi:hypothetical protein ABIA39_006964 [Nocardia sp. GAS34]|uniref:hypothetical protein n=1 Tax=unclassified Nocardia TaxID=2637762 RepID=UPI003D24F904
MLRYACSNPWCYQGWHYTPSCPWQVLRSDAPAARPRLRTAQEEAALRRWLERKQQEAAEAADLERWRAQFKVPDRDVVEPETRDPGHGWLLVFVPVAVVVGLAMLALVFLH